MKKLKLSSLQVSPKDLLTREQMKSVFGGSGGSSTCANGQWWLMCVTPGGYENWCRSSNSGNANTECQNIYPAYNPGDVTGQWAPVICVGSGC